MSEMNRIECRIAGNDYVLYSQREPEKMMEIARFVEEKIQSVESKKSYYNQNLPISLAAVNIADELFAVREEFDAFKKMAEEPMTSYRPNQAKISDLAEKNRQFLEERDLFKNRSQDLSGRLTLLEEKYNRLLEDSQAKDLALKESDDRLYKLRENLSAMEKKLVDLSKQLQEYKRTN